MFILDSVCLPCIICVFSLISFMSQKYFEFLLFAGWGSKREEAQISLLPVGGSSPGSGLPDFGCLCFQSEIFVGPESGEGKPKYHLRARHSSALLKLSEVNAVCLTDERHPELPHLQIIQVRSKKKKCERKMDGQTSKQRQPLETVLYLSRLKDVWAVEETAVFSSAHVLAVGSVILSSLGCDHRSLFTALNVGLLHLSTFCSNCKHILTMKEPGN